MPILEFATEIQTNKSKELGNPQRMILYLCHSFFLFSPEIMLGTSPASPLIKADLSNRYF